MNRRRILRGAATVFGTGPFALHAINSQTTAIEVVGIGSAGNSVVERIVADGMVGIESIAMGTDAQALLKVSGPETMLLGASTTKGLGSGGNPEIGRRAAIEDRPRIEHALCGASLVVIAAGMGGGTGTGASPIVAQIANGLGIPAVGVVTRPMNFENRARAAEDGIAELVKHADRVLVNRGEDVLEQADHDISLEALLDAVRDVQIATVRQVVQPPSAAATTPCWMTYTSSTYDAEIERLLAVDKVLDIYESGLSLPPLLRRQIED